MSRENLNANSCEFIPQSGKSDIESWKSWEMGGNEVPGYLCRYKATAIIPQNLFIQPVNIHSYIYAFSRHFFHSDKWENVSHFGIKLIFKTFQCTVLQINKVMAYLVFILAQRGTPPLPVWHFICSGDSAVGKNYCQESDRMPWLKKPEVAKLHYSLELLLLPINQQ